MGTRISSKTSVVVAIIAAVLAVLGAPATAAPPGDITEYPLPSDGGDPWFVVTGPDDNFWFTEYGELANKIGRITPRGSIT